MKSQKGSTLLEGLIAIAIFSFGALGTMAFQVKMLERTTINSNRLEATMYISSLVGSVDPAKLECYVYPKKTGSLDCVAEHSYLDTWITQVSSMKGAKDIVPTSTLDTKGNLIINITWAGTHKVSSFVNSPISI